MYDLYKERPWGSIIMALLFSGGGIAMACGGVYDCVIRGFSFNTVMFFIFSVFIFFMAFAFFMMGKSNPYEWVDKIKETDPQRVEAMEQDYNNSQELLYNIWKGKLNYYFKGTDFFAVPIGQIRSMEVSVHYKRNIGRYLKCIISSDEGTVQVDVLLFIVNKNEALEIINHLAIESGIEPKIDL